MLCSSLRNYVEFTGIYEYKGYGKFKISIGNDSLFSRFNEKKQYLNHFHYDLFEFNNVKNGKIDTTAIGNFKDKF
ncbi:DUF3471 domain-containing protein [Winogradskyella bathintestinalis]|uniref:DUF3471 domain-containing protein n=1 Tax=Winogradskyella bathintestinalis TaxID=3035208 RepID=UPI00389B2221